MNQNSSKKECDKKVNKNKLEQVLYLCLKQFFQVANKMKNVKWKIAKGKRQMENGKWQPLEQEQASHGTVNNFG